MKSINPFLGSSLANLAPSPPKKGGREKDDREEWEGMKKHKFIF